MKFLILDHFVQDHLDFHVKKVHKKAEEKSGKEWTGKRDTCKRNPQYCDRCDRNFASDAHFLTHCKKVHNEIPPQFQGLYNTGWFKKQFSPCWLEPW